MTATETHKIVAFAQAHDISPDTPAREVINRYNNTFGTEL